MADDVKLPLPFAEYTFHRQKEIEDWKSQGITDYREDYLRKNPEYGEYLEFAEWYMKRHGLIRWREDGRFDAAYAFAESTICLYLHEFPDPIFGHFLGLLARYTQEDILNLWADDELLSKLVQITRTRVLKARLN